MPVPKQSMENLTEPMFYVLMAFVSAPMCGVDVVKFAEKRSHGRLRMGPATLYTVIGRFEKEKLIREIDVDGRKRTYRVTDKGRAAYENELGRLERCVADAVKMPGAAEKPTVRHIRPKGESAVNIRR